MSPLTLDPHSCPYCKRAGLVRFEHVLSKGGAYRLYYCGACERTWQGPDEPTPRLEETRTQKR
jgi:hypothetical protein